jgi:hypothetical protein
MMCHLLAEKKTKQFDSIRGKIRSFRLDLNLRCIISQSSSRQGGIKENAGKNNKLFPALKI